jgi:RNA polymerase sigma factor (sigma-70 family)
MEKLFYWILKGKSLPDGHISTRKDGSRWQKRNKKWVRLPKGRTKKDGTVSDKKKKKVEEPKLKKGSGGFYTKFSKFLDKIKKMSGIGRSDVINKKIQEEYKDAIEHGIKTGDQKFLMSYLHYFSNKKKWDQKFQQWEKQKERGFNFNPSSGNFKAIGDTIRKAKAEKNKKPYDKKSMRFLWEKYGDKTTGALEIGAPLELDRETRFKDYKSGDKQLLIGREDITQLPTMNYLSKDLQSSLAVHQQDSVNLAMEKFHAGEKGFLIADGTGAGKTRQGLALADSYLKTKDNQKPVIIVTESDNILNTAWVNDAKEMGLEINNAKVNGFIAGKINITTYSQAEKIKDFEDLGLLIFDESHNLKNDFSNTSKFLMSASNRADHVLNMSATPVEKPEHVHYIAKTMGFDADMVSKFLQPKKSSAFDQALNVDSFMEDLTRKGLIVKREVSLSNLDLEIKKVDMPSSAKNLLDGLLSKYKSERGKANELMSLRRVTEEMKVDIAMDHLKKELKEGKQVVLFADRIGDIEIYGHKSKGTLPLLEKKLKEMGISFESVYGEADSKGENAVSERVKRFQSGQSKVIIGNPESMGTGISLDDTKGDSPRTLICLTPPFSAMSFIQMIGRVNRLKTKGRSKAIMLSSDHYTDTWGLGILRNKAEYLGASVKGDYEALDLENGGAPTVGVRRPPPPIDTSIFKPKKFQEQETTVKSLLYWILKGKSLPTGHITTRKDGFKWQKQGDGSWKKLAKGKEKKEPKKKPVKKGKKKVKEESPPITPKQKYNPVDYLPDHKKEELRNQINDIADLMAKINSDDGVTAFPELKIKDQPLVDISKYAPRSKYDPSVEEATGIAKGDERVFGSYMHRILWAVDDRFPMRVNGVSPIVNKMCFSLDEDARQDVVMGTMEKLLVDFQNKTLLYNVPLENLNSYMIGVMKNLARNENRRQSKTESLPEDSNFENDDGNQVRRTPENLRTDSVEDQHFESEEKETADAIIEEGKKKLQEVSLQFKGRNAERNKEIWEMYLANKRGGNYGNYQEIARKLRVTTETVKQVIKNAKKKIKI